MTLINPLWGSNLVSSSGFDTTLIGNSVWLDGSADFLSAELGAKTRTKAVIGTWIQKTGFSTSDATFFSKKGSAQFAIRMQDQSSKAGKISIFDYDGSSFQYEAESTTMVLRDIGWYHIMISIDTTASAGSRLKYYINGIDQTSTLTVTTDYTASDNPSITGGSGEPTQWGVGYSGTSQFIPCYLAQSFMLDDDSIQNSDVAVTDILDSFTFGTNGSQFGPKKNAAIATLASSAGGDSFCLDFSDSGGTDAANLGNDISSNNNDFTPTSMAVANQSSNTPSLTFPLLNPLSAAFSTTLSNGNTTASGSTGNGDDINPGIIIPKTGKWVWQITNTTDADLIYGVRNFVDMKAGDYSYTNLFGFYSHTGTLVQGASPSGSYLDAASGGDVYQFYYNADTRKMWVSDNGTIPNSGDPDAGSNEAFTIPDSGFDLCPTALVGGTAPNSTFDFGLSGVSLHANGQDFKPLTSENFDAPDKFGVDHFQPVLYTGNGSSRTISTDVVPGLVWIKNRDTTDEHKLVDKIRGATKELSSDDDTIEQTDSNGLTAFASDGFTLGSGANGYNDNTEKFVSWVFGNDGTRAANTAGAKNIFETVDSSGAFAIFDWDGDSTAGAFQHSMGGAIEMIIVKRRNVADWNWYVWHKGIPDTKAYLLDTNDTGHTSTYWNDVAVNAANQFTLGATEGINVTGDEIISYAFRSVPGVCKVGTYEGNNNANGTLINLGFTPAFFMAKNIDATGSWFVLDSARGFSSYLQAEDPAAETTGTVADRLADGMKWRTTGGGNAANTFIYLAIADIGGNGTLPPVYGK